jgi:hypothetical protein
MAMRRAILLAATAVSARDAAWPAGVFHMDHGNLLTEYGNMNSASKLSDGYDIFRPATNGLEHGAQAYAHAWMDVGGQDLERGGQTAKTQALVYFKDRRFNPESAHFDPEATPEDDDEVAVFITKGAPGGDLERGGEKTHVLVPLVPNNDEDDDEEDSFLQLGEERMFPGPLGPYPYAWGPYGALPMMCAVPPPPPIPRRRTAERLRPSLLAAHAPAPNSQGLCWPPRLHGRGRHGRR